MHIVEAERLVVDLEITGQERKSKEEKAEAAGQSEEVSTTRKEVVEITAEEARERIAELYNYYQWFYVRMPYDIEFLLKEGKTYNIYADGCGGIFWMEEGETPSAGFQCAGIYKSEQQESIVDLPWYGYTMESSYRSDLQKIGSMNWRKPELSKPQLPSLLEDGYVREVEAYIRNELSEKKKDGTYQVYFGRYEDLGRDVRSISVAVTGEETFYLQCWVTKYEDGTYECLPVGGSYMGEKKAGMEKAERIIQLGRLVTELEINEFGVSQ